MRDQTVFFLLASRIVAVVFAIGFGVFYTTMAMLLNRPLPLSNLLLEWLAILYIMGLLIGLKWPAVGGGLCFLLPVFGIIQLFFPQPLILVSPIPFLVMMIPGLLFFLSWYFQRQSGIKGVQGDV